MVVAYMETMNALIRQTAIFDVTIPSGQSRSNAFDMRAYSMGHILNTTNVTDSIGFAISDSESGTYRLLTGNDGVALTCDDVADNANELPAELAGASWVKLAHYDIAASPPAESNVGADAVVTVGLKS